VPTRPAWVLVLCLLTLAGGCATGGFIRVHWRGFTTSTGAECPRMELALVVENGHVGGWADSEHPWGRTAWDVTGTVAPDGQVALSTVTQDPRVSPGTVTWRGKAGMVALTLTEEAGGCPVPRTADLRQ
jgi:hypothetical protein